MEALFQNDYVDSDSHSSSNDRCESDSDIPINSDYKEESSNEQVHNSINSQPIFQVIGEVNASVNEK